MMNEKALFLKMLEVELDDLSLDMGELEELYRMRHASDTIAPQVFLDTFALIQNELFGMAGFSQDVDEADVGDFESVDDIISSLNAKLRQRMIERGVDDQVVLLIERKMKKIRRYMILSAEI